MRTGAEQIIAHRTDEMFAVTARKSGRVTKVSDRSVSVEYEDGSKASYQIGRRFGKAAGAIMPHQLEANVVEGAEFEAGDCLVYNSHYFRPNAFNPKAVDLMLGAIASTAIMDTPDTLEDSSAISAALADRMETRISYTRDITVTFDQSIRNLVRVGDQVAADDILCYIEDPVTAQNRLFDEESIDTLRLISANAPRAKHKGTVESIEVFYNGEIDELSESLSELAMTSDRNRRRLARDMNTRYISGQVGESMKVEGNPLLPSNAVIRIHITSDVGTGAGDKFVFGNQLKTIVRRVFDGRHETESGQPVDAIFSYASINNRIVNSCQIMGTTNTLLRVISRKMFEAYQSDDS